MRVWYGQGTIVFLLWYRFIGKFIWLQCATIWICLWYHIYSEIFKTIKLNMSSNFAFQEMCLPSQWNCCIIFWSNLFITLDLILPNLSVLCFTIKLKGEKMKNIFRNDFNFDSQVGILYSDAVYDVMTVKPQLKSISSGATMKSLWHLIFSTVGRFKLQI